MKNCGYCGRENSEEAANCRECGTQLIEPASTAIATKPRDRAWLREMGRVLAYAGLILAIGILYLLSFGPVGHYCGTVILQNPPPSTIAVNGQTWVPISVRKVRYPLWVGIFYRPAFMLTGNALYGRYLQWWDESPKRDGKKINVQPGGNEVSNPEKI